MIFLLAALLFLTACSQVPGPTTEPSPLPTLSSTETPKPTTTPTQRLVSLVPLFNGTFHLAIDPGTLAATFYEETNPAVEDSESVPYWEALPEYSQVMLEGYPISDHLIKPQIFIYPLAELVAVNDSAGQVVESLHVPPEDIDTSTPVPSSSNA